MFGDIVNLNHRVALATADAPSLAGVGISMEGIDQNPVYYAAALDAVWQLVNATDAREGLEGDDEASRRGVVSSNSSGCPNCCEPSCLCACGTLRVECHRSGAGADPRCCPVPSDPPGRNTTEYLIEWGYSRCGQRLPQVAEAWALLAQTVYRPGQPSSLHRKYCSAYAPAIYPANSDMLKCNPHGHFWIVVLFG